MDSTKDFTEEITKDTCGRSWLPLKTTLPSQEATNSDQSPPREAINADQTPSKEATPLRPEHVLGLC